MTPKFQFVSTLPTTIRSRKPSDLLSEYAAALRARQGQWAKWPRKVSQSSSYAITDNVRKGAYPALPAPGYEAATRNGVTYVRYVGHQDAA
ncbi:hypothetical protein [Nocardia sp. NPDC051833]|uniref:hypothetical protein n=1 Tax=Nocardia sp. NPDC051833 TaxID=3155674 RepID=UPI00342A8C48